MKPLFPLLRMGVVWMALSMTVLGVALPEAPVVEAQPLLLHTEKLIETLGSVGAPLDAGRRARLEALTELPDDGAITRATEAELDPLCVAAVVVAADGTMSARPRGEPVILEENGWRTVLVKVINEAGLTGRLRVESPQAKPIPHGPAEEVDTRWMGLSVFEGRPLAATLSGLGLEYRLLQIYGSQPGDKTGTLEFRIGEAERGREDNADAEGKGGPTAGAAAALAWRVVPSTEVRFVVHDADGLPCMGTFEIRDGQGRVYPTQPKRKAPDMFFHSQIYRETGESVRLARGVYTVRCSHGPESIPEVKTLVVGEAPVEVVYRVARWIDTDKHGYWSGDHHIHAAGCLHYESPSQGIMPTDMLRHIMGEDVKVGCCLTWGPCFDFQKQFFTGRPDSVSRHPYLLRYDVEVSGFGSHESGHLNLLRLKEQIPPGGDSKGHWPTLGLNTLRWAKQQGAITGPAHSGNGLTTIVGRTEGEDGPHRLPNFDLPAYDGIGANEFVMNITHELPGPDGRPLPAIDFISTMDTDRVAEWNMWYHALNCGFPVVASGETDFPCISGERVGMGRVYVKLDGPLDYERWVEGLRAGRSYVSDGQAHLMDFARAADGTFTVTAAVRRDGAAAVPVELIVNGRPVAVREVKADGTLSGLRFDAPAVTRSSWVAVRVFPHAHTNPIVVSVDNRPVRASRHSAEWLLAGLEQCWKTKERTYKDAERDQAAAAYDHARRVYRAVIEESEPGS